jgi:predicted nucleotidyltransferase component of viral defense system
MQDKIHIDVDIGDIVKPFSQDIYLFQYKGHPLFEKEVSLMVYPSETIFAEKLETMISKGTANSRMKDYHDLLLLIRDAKLINFKILKDAITDTFKNRKRTLELLSFDEPGLKSLQKLWAAHLKNLGNIAQELNLPKEMYSTIKEINDYIEQLGLT